MTSLVKIEQTGVVKQTCPKCGAQHYIGMETIKYHPNKTEADLAMSGKFICQQCYNKRRVKK